MSPAPWTQKDNLSPIYDAAGDLVSFTEQGPKIVAAVNAAESAAYLLETLSKAIARATGPNASAIGAIELIALAPAAKAMVDRLRGYTCHAEVKGNFRSSNAQAMLEG